MKGNTKAQWKDWVNGREISWIGIDLSFLSCLWLFRAWIGGPNPNPASSTSVPQSRPSTWPHLKLYLFEYLTKYRPTRLVHQASLHWPDPAPPPSTHSSRANKAPRPNSVCTGRKFHSGLEAPLSCSPVPSGPLRPLPAPPPLPSLCSIFWGPAPFRGRVAKPGS